MNEEKKEAGDRAPTKNNPFAGARRELQEQSTTSMEAVEAHRSIAEVQAAMAIAKKFPRDPKKAMERIIDACRRPSLAEQAIYDYPKGDQKVSGPSIRLAEAIAQNWGNINFGIKELGQHDGMSTVMVYAWDLETNTRSEKVFEVPHIRHTRKGDYKLTDPRDIYEMVANQGARRMRNCIVSVIPGDVIDVAMAQVSETMRMKMDAPEKQIRKMIAQFKKYGVESIHIESYLGHNISSIAYAEIVSLRNIFNSLKDGYSTPDKWFDMDIANSGNGQSGEKGGKLP